jgi:hypothetical protein
VRVLAASLFGDGDAFHSDFLINVIFPEVGTKIAKQARRRFQKSDSAPGHSSLLQFSADDR